MGYAISYSSANPVSESHFAEILSLQGKLNAEYTWLSCEPLLLHRAPEGHLAGVSKPNFDPHPDDRASAEAEGKPDGTVRELLDALCLISRRFNIEWQIGDDYKDNIGTIQAGEFDDAVWQHIDALAIAASMMQGDLLEDLENMDDFEPGTGFSDDEDDDDPPIFRFPGAG